MNAATIIAKEFCFHREDRRELWPCPACMSHAVAALHELAGQGTIFDTPAADVVLSDPDANTPGVRSKHASDTSVAARFAVQPKTGSQRARVLSALIDAYYNPTSLARGLTDDEMIVALRIPHQSVGPRRGELVAGNWIYDSGYRRETRSGADAIVWTLTAAGVARVNGTAERAS